MQPLEEIADGLAERGWAIARGVYPEKALAELEADARRLHAEGRFRGAAVGRGVRRAPRDEVRGDEIFWLDPEALSAPQAAYWEGVEALRITLNRLLFLGIVGFEGHLAVFAPQRFYRRHLDRFSDSDERVVSSVLFLNSGWRTENGGALRLYLDAGTVDVSPESGTLVVFRSELIWHEVLPPNVPRFSAAGWYRRRSSP